MCGICGVHNYKSHSPVDRPLLKKMTDVLIHRGPDDEGFYVEDNLGFGFRRLSIIDLESGHQPIHNEDESIWVVFNGEIYNFQELRKELERKGHRFYTAADTEVLVHLYEEYGEGFVHKLRGMFAFALWDRLRRRLLLVRDRIGIKPLYYLDFDGRLMFASEIKAIIQDPDVPREVDLEALDDYLFFRYVPGPKTIFKGIQKLPPGHLLTCDEQGITVKQYWGLETIEPEEELNEIAAIEKLQALLEEAVRLRLISDVPLGAMLSGGIDSSTIVAVMSRALPQPVKTFSVGFRDEPDFNEFIDARRTALYFQTEHHELATSLEDNLGFFSEMIWHLDEPIANLSAIAFYFICKLARERVTVALCGQGADELLAGYNRYLGYKLGNYYSMLFPFLRRKIIPSLVEKIPGIPLAQRALRAYGEEEDWARFASINAVFTTDMRELLYNRDLEPREPERIYQNYLEKLGNKFDPLNRILYLDFKTWLVDDLLTVFDKMSMATSLELRVPFLEHLLVEFVFSLPSYFKLRGWKTKYILRQAVSSWLPPETLRKKKMGFPAPANRWFRGAMKGYLRETLLSQSVEFFNHDYIRRLLDEHEQGYRDHSRQLGTLLCFTLWYNIYIRGHPAGKSF